MLTAKVPSKDWTAEMSCPKAACATPGRENSSTQAKFFVFAHLFSPCLAADGAGYFATAATM
jgi:hypothetical protein